MRATRSPRFPYVAALYCAACVGAAGWMWMRYSYCWAVTPETLCAAVPESVVTNRYVDGEGPFEARTFPGYADGDRFVLLVGRYKHDERIPYALLEEDYALRYVAVEGGSGVTAWLLVEREADVPSPGSPCSTTARVCGFPGTGYHFWPEGQGSSEIREIDLPILFATAERFRPASIAGLAVGVMGLFVFTMALRHWLRERGDRTRDASRAESVSTQDSA